MRKLLVHSLSLLLLMALGSCDDKDSDDYPPLITDMVVASMDASGVMATVSLDNGESYDVRAQGLATDVKDTVVRCLASYTLDEGRMEVYGVSRVFSARPYKAAEVLQDAEGHPVLDSLPRDPVKVVSLWKSGGYVNMQLGLLTTGNGTHSYAFIEDSVGHYSLAHLRPAGDAESYTQRLYLSMPIPEGVESLTFSVYTYDGIHTRAF